MRVIVLICIAFITLKINVYAEEKVLLDVPSYNQRELGLWTGCEIVSVAMVLNYEFSVDAIFLAETMPKSPDPNKGYVGDPYSKTGFTIFPTALEGVIEMYAPVYNMSGCTIDGLKGQLRLGMPVAVWVNGLGFNVHCIALTGYDSEGFYYNDPWTGEKNVHIGFGTFEDMWGKAIYDESTGYPYSGRKAISYYKSGGGEGLSPEGNGEGLVPEKSGLEKNQLKINGLDAEELKADELEKNAPEIISGLVKYIPVLRALA
ncbi:MAG: C39 family peptidase [Clostridiales bacterium]|jgi:uncharacterized protein YvpB|nr:C39 family peptidase [Clostridiales bacterium]